MLTGIGRDVRHAARLFIRQPGFTAIALLTLAIGVGATTALFSVVNAVVLRPLPVEESDRLVRIFESNQARGWTTFSVAAANFVDWARESRTFESMAAMQGGTAALLASGEAEQVPAVRSSAELFTVLRGSPALGRTFVNGDDTPGAPAVAVIGYRLWQRRFGGDASAIGRLVTIDDRPTTIVGVMAEDFGRGAADTDVWLPLPVDRVTPERGGRTWQVVGRLADDATLARARAEMEGIAARLASTYPDANGGWSVRLVPLDETVVGPAIRRALLVLLGAVAFVLLIACVNVASLLSARGIARQREIAIRAALGAGRTRLVRQVLTESLLLGVVGGALGIVLALWGTQLLLALAPPSLPRITEVNVDARVLAAGLLATLASCIVFGLVPALQATTVRPDETLQDTTRGTTHPRRRRMSHAFVVAEIGLAVVLLVGAGLFVRSFLRLSQQSLGFRPEQALVFTLSLPGARYQTPASVTQFYLQVLERVRALPGVSGVGATHALPFSGMDSVRPFIREGEPLAEADAPTSEYRLITPGYFGAMGIPIVRGRDFAVTDAPGKPGVAIINESFVRRFFAGRDPIGQRIRQGGDNPEIPWLTIVGVAGDVRHRGLAAAVEPEMFWAESQATWGATLNRHRRGLTMVVRTAGDPAAVIPSIRSAVSAVDPNRPLIDARPLTSLIRRSADMQRFSMALFATFAAVGLLLAAAGVYGVMSYTVEMQRRDMGIRLALGARPAAVLAQVLRSGLQLAVLGAALGLAAAWMLDDVVRTQLFETPPHDALTFICVSALLLATAALACYLPARRASRVDPVEALRD